ncbi:MAG TPA: TonB-dependent receptor, partial [Rhodocyclaceae bacterium]|nr:TonB-dependent receptor [Rhodocyclaceae bacterium]
MPTSLSRTLVPWIVLLGACESPALATTGFEHAFLEPLPVVLTMSRMPMALRDTPGAVTVIDQELIRASGYRDIGRLFRLVPGMQVGQERGNDQWVTYHGLGLDFPNQMQLLIDGRSVNTPHFDWGKLRLALDDIERIEVVRGSDAAAYGSNAFLGVVNILTRHTGSESGSSARAAVGHRGIGDASGHALLRGGPLGLRITAAHQHDDGFSALHDGRRMSALNVRGDLRLGRTDELTLHAGLLDGRRETGYPNTPFDGNAEREPSYRDGHLHLRWQRALGADSEVSLAWSYSREYTRERWTVFAPAQPIIYIPIDASRRQRRSNLELQHRFAAGADLRVTWGLEWRRDTLDAPLYFHGQGVKRQELARAFANFEWRLSESWLVHGGTMAERQPGSATRHAPRLFVTWQPDAAHSWRLGYSRAW